MSYILKVVKPSALQNWIATNAPGSLKRTARESWRAYLQANSGVGNSIAALESTYLKALGKAGSSLEEAWGKQLAGTGKTNVRAQSTYK